MQIQVVKSKIHQATITHANLHYIGSITIDRKLMDAARLVEGEKVQVVNINNGERLETYVIEGEYGKGELILNGAAARLVQPQDKVIIIAYGLIDFDKANTVKPAIIFPDDHNQIDG